MAADNVWKAGPRPDFLRSPIALALGIHTEFHPATEAGRIE
jgi:hypothetical protein